jgi:Tfp pilus assembly PilM family ATPase
MTRRISGRFAARPEAERAVEHLVQEYGLDPGAIQVSAEGPDNTAGVVVAGADADPATGQPRAAARAGMILVTADVEEAVAERAERALQEAAGGKPRG